MTIEEETKSTVERYFAAWTSKRVDEAYALLAPNLEFCGPSAKYDSAEAFRPGLVGFAQLTKWARVIEILVQGNRAAMLYECELPAPAGVMRIASFFRIEGGKIRWYETQFDATEFKKLIAR
jgi:hypothetical protein